MRGLRNGLGEENDLDSILSSLYGREDQGSHPEISEEKETETQGKSTMSMVRRSRRRRESALRLPSGEDE